jgi:hypothetical protein
VPISDSCTAANRPNYSNTSQARVTVPIAGAVRHRGRSNPAHDHHFAPNIRSRFAVPAQNQDDLSTTLRNARPAANARQLSTMIWNRRSLR